MRLLNTPTRQIEDVLDCEAPQYAVLSHAWCRDEVDFKDLNIGGDWKSKEKGTVEPATAGHVWKLEINQTFLDKVDDVRRSSPLHQYFARKTLPSRQKQMEQWKKERECLNDGDAVFDARVPIHVLRLLDMCEGTETIEKKWASIIFLEHRTRDVPDIPSQLSQLAADGDKKAALLLSKTYGVINIRRRHKWSQALSNVLLLSQLMASIPVTLYQPHPAHPQPSGNDVARFRTALAQGIRKLTDSVRQNLNETLPSSLSLSIIHPTPTTFVLCTLLLSILLTVYHHRNTYNRFQQPFLFAGITLSFVLSVITWIDDSNLANVIMPVFVIASLGISRVAEGVRSLMAGGNRGQKREKLAKVIDQWIADTEANMGSKPSDIRYITVE